jgi:hypothetical protein
LLRRLMRGETIWLAHRSHFYQCALTRGFTVTAIVARVLLLNVALATLAIVSVRWEILIVQAMTLACGALLVGWLLYIFERGKAG